MTTACLRRRPAPAIALLAIAFASQSSLAQTAFRLEVSQRWIDSGQQARKIPLDHRSTRLFLRSSRPRPDSLTYSVSLDTPVNAVLRATIDASADGRNQRIDMTSRFSYPLVDDSIIRLRDSLLMERPFSLSESRVWDLIPSFHPARLERGERWTDTLRFKTEECGSEQSTYGVRVSTLLGDTTVGGRRLWIVTDSADVYYEEIIAMGSQPRDTLHISIRSAQGILKGRMLYDPAIGLFIEREDVAALSGSAYVSYADGRSSNVPSRFERRRRWDLFDTSLVSASARGH
jgi:hypothetical protein